MFIVRACSALWKSFFLLESIDMDTSISSLSGFGRILRAKKKFELQEPVDISVQLLVIV